MGTFIMLAAFIGIFYFLLIRPQRQQQKRHDQMVKGLKDVDRMPGKDFQIITVSMAAYETTELAQKQKDRYLAMLDRPGAEEGWHFLTGDEASIQALADAVGFGFNAPVCCAITAIPTGSVLY